MRSRRPHLLGRPAADPAPGPPSLPPPSSCSIEHVKHSACRQEFLDRVKRNAALKKEAKAKGEFINLKRVPALPRVAHTISREGNLPQTLAPVKYDTTI